MDCLFCKIIQGKIPSYKIYEDENAIGILDIFPNTKGQSLVISKKHFEADFTKMPNKKLQQFIVSVKKVAELLKRTLKVYKVALVIEGVGVNHLHAKLYPLHGLTKEFQPAEATETVFYETYPGFTDTRLGKRANDQDLKKLQQKMCDTEC